MAKQRKKAVSRKRPHQKKPAPEKNAVSQADLNRLEFHRNVAAVMPDPKDKWPGIAIQMEGSGRNAGQRRGVQVFKLVTQGTLEEKIAAIIKKKRATNNQKVEISC